MRTLKKLLIPLLFLTAAVILSTCCLYKSYPLRYPELIYKYSDMYNLPPEVVCSVINTESHFDETASSHAGAQGLMQLMEPTADWAAQEAGIQNYSYKNITQPDLNIHLGCWLLNYLLSRYDGNLDTALCAYNAGSGNVDKWLITQNSDTDLNHVPFEETKNYLKTVKKQIKAYRFILNIIGGKYES